MSFDGTGYLLGPDDGPQWWLLDTRMNIKAATGAFTLIEWSAPEGFGPPPHIHGLEDEAFYILDGEIDIECGDKRFTAGPGDFALLPRGIPHGFVVTRGPVRGLQITTPSGFEEFVAEAGRPATRPGLPEPSVPDIPLLIAAGQRLGHQIVGPPPGPPSPGRS
ncbi:cupin domain-containing protein [Actinoplanes sp. NPDC049802]|uniref:cupin domain-containing protein n=1 Tax=Actinoplanes sp. NPDC049802 TaxID=3154742 RepID=UPI00340F4C2C